MIFYLSKDERVRMLEKNGYTNNSKDENNANPIVIGLTGSFGSGCTEFIGKELLQEIGKKFLQKNEKFKWLSLSDVLKEMYFKEKGKKNPSRAELQSFGNEKRKGSTYFFAKETCKVLKKEDSLVVIDSIRNPGEVEYLRKKYPMFFLFGIYADKDVRWERVKKKYKRNLGQFEDDDKRDTGEDEPPYGQRVRDCYLMSDIIIPNNMDTEKDKDQKDLMTKTINKYVSMITGKGKKYPPTEEETIMAMAYANSCRSSCLKRKVGAILIDDYGNVFSSGYNEVPINENTCYKLMRGCYRDIQRTKIFDEINDLSKSTKKAEDINDLLKKKYKMLDYCRALHAEENAILNVARFGSSVPLKGATLYTTTYPCNLCAKKISQVGIRKIVYLEPYPQEESKKIIKNGKIEEKPFEGVLFNGYFRLFGGV